MDALRDQDEGFGILWGFGLKRCSDVILLLFSICDILLMSTLRMVFSVKAGHPASSAFLEFFFSV